MSLSQSMGLLASQLVQNSDGGQDYPTSFALAYMLLSCSQLCNSTSCLDQPSFELGHVEQLFTVSQHPQSGNLFACRLGLVGDLGQTLDSAKTLQHLVDVQPQSILNVGDLSYADGYQPRWDTYGRLVQPSTAHVAWMNIEGAAPHPPLPSCFDCCAYTSHLPCKVSR